MPSRRSGSASISGSGGPVDNTEQPGALVRAVHRKPPPIAVLPQVGEETARIFMKMQKGPAFDIEYPRPLLDKTGSRPEVLQQIAERLKGACSGVFHVEAL